MNIREQLQCKIYPFGTQPDKEFVVVCSFYKGQYLLSRHKKRDTWETQGGHIEAGETPMDAARRELFEESGAADATLYPVCDYLGFDPEGQAYGAVFLAEIHALGKLPESEMKDVQLFDDLPARLTYPHVTPVFMDLARRIAAEKSIL